MADIHVLPGIERRDLGPSDLDAKEVLDYAIEAGVTDVVVIGTGRDGRLYVASSLGDADRAVGKMMRAVSLLSEAHIVRAAPTDTA